ncbi:tyrosine-type recombinase/integrase [Desulfoplanes sp. PS50]
MKLKEVMRNAEDIIREIKLLDVEDKTKAEYLNIANRVRKDPDRLLYQGSKGYYYKKKAALRYFIQHYLRLCIKKINSKSMEEENIKKIGRKIIYLINLYKKHGRNNGKSPVTTKSPGKSKRKSLRKMPKYWREMMWDRCANYDYKGALAILQLTGARPSEIERGVIVVGDESSEFLEVVIKGSKQGKAKKNGQAKRSIFIDMRVHVYHRSPKDYLLSCVAEDGYVIVQANAKRLNDYVRRLSQKIWPKKKNPITPYSYRHQLSADLKGEGCPPPKISMTLGHRSVLSKKKYGTSAQARGSTHIGEVRCSHALREPQRSHPWEQIQASGTG